MCALKWSDIDYNSKTVTIRRSRTKTKARGEFDKDTKTHLVKALPLREDVVVSYNESPTSPVFGVARKREVGSGGYFALTT